jgi:hypothetical protein
MNSGATQHSKGVAQPSFPMVSMGLLQVGIGACAASSLKNGKINYGAKGHSPILEGKRAFLAPVTVKLIPCIRPAAASLTQSSYVKEGGGPLLKQLAHL